MIDWPKLIQGIIEKSDLSQADIARLCGVTRSAICLLMAGKRSDPSYSLGENLVKIAKKHKVKVVYLG